MFDEVVRSRRVLMSGSRDWRVEWKVEIDVSDGRGNESVEGRPKPGKEVRRMLTVCVDIVTVYLVLLVEASVMAV